MTGDTTPNLAVLIDADNAMPSITRFLLAEVAKYGTSHVKRAYGDWTSINLQGLEGRAPQAFDPADPAVRVHPRQKCD